MNRFTSIALSAIATIGVMVLSPGGVASATSTDAATLQLPRVYAFSSISTQTSLAGIGFFGRSRDNPKKCVVATVQAQFPPSLHLVGVTKTSCNLPEGSIRAIPFYDSLNGDKNASTVHVLSLIPKTDQVVIGPTLLAYTELSDVQVEQTSAAGSIWLYLCDTANGAQLLHISQTSGAVLGIIPMPSICRAAVSSSEKGFSMRPILESGSISNSVIGIYDVSPGATKPVLVKACKPSNTGGWSC